jgi:Xaa-Pro aminopeptidase
METETRLRIPIPNEVYAKRRKDVISGLSKNQVAAIQPKKAELDITHTAVPDRDLTYLVPHFESKAALVIAPGFAGGETILFVEDSDEVEERWAGRRVGVKDAKKLYGVDDVRPLKDLEKLLKGELQFRDPVDPTHSIIPEMRLIKGDEEIALLRQAGYATAVGFNTMLETAMYGMSGFMVQGILEAGFREAGGHGLSFPTIVVSGEDVCLLHGAPGPDPIKNGKMVLVDAGASVWGYASDVTRTFPSGETFSREQEVIYKVLLSGLEAALANIGPGKKLLDSYYESTRAMLEAANEWGVFKANRDWRQLIGSDVRRACIPHGPSHWVGLHVHDCGATSEDLDNSFKPEFANAAETPFFKDRKLKPGMVFSVEPGFYVQSKGPGSEQFRENFAGLGGRLEITVLVTPDGFEDLTKGIPSGLKELYASRSKAYEKK